MKNFIDRLSFLAGGTKPHPWGTRLGWDRGLISRTFTGKQLPGPEALAQLATIERVNLTWLLTGEGAPYAVEAPPLAVDLPLEGNGYYLFLQGDHLCPPLVRVETGKEPRHIIVYSGASTDLMPSIRRLVWKGIDIHLAPHGPEVERLRLGQASNASLFNHGLGMLERELQILNAQNLGVKLQLGDDCRNYLQQLENNDAELTWVLTLRELDEKRRSILLGLAHDLERAQKSGG